MNSDQLVERRTRGVGAVSEFLKRKRARYELIDHAETFAATEEAHAAATSPARMAKTVLPVFDAGAVPPFGLLLGTPEILDPRLLRHRSILCSGGHHRHTLKISPREIERLGEPLVARHLRGTECARHRPAH